MTPKKKPAPPPTEERDPRPTVAERVACIRRELLARSWVASRDVELRAEEWGVSHVLVRHHATEAQRQIEAATDTRQQLAEIDSLLREATDRARLEKKDADAARALVAVAEVRRKISGVGEHRDPRNDPKVEKKEDEWIVEIAEEKPAAH